MLYLIPLPIVFIAAIVKVISVRYKLKIFSFISSVVIGLGIIYFILAYSKYNGFDILEHIINFFKI